MNTALSQADVARAAYELRRSAANTPARAIAARVTIATATTIHTYDAVGFSTAAIEASARELYGDAPIGISVKVKQ
jgi:hypothetical protein